MFNESFQEHYLSKFITNRAKLQNQPVRHSVHMHYDVSQCNVLKGNVAITILSNAIVPT